MYEGWEFVPSGDGRTSKYARPVHEIMTSALITGKPCHRGWQYGYTVGGDYTRVELPFRAEREAIWQVADALYRGEALYFSEAKAAVRCSDLMYALRATKSDERVDRMLALLSPESFSAIRRGLARCKNVPTPLEQGLAELERLGTVLRDRVNKGT